MRLVKKKLQADEDERELKEIFRVLDKEKKGEVNVNELRCVSAFTFSDLLKHLEYAVN